MFDSDLDRRSSSARTARTCAAAHFWQVQRPPSAAWLSGNGESPQFWKPQPARRLSLRKSRSCYSPTPVSA